MLADHVLLGEVLTMAMPVGLVVVVGVYWTMLLRRRSAGARTGKTE